MGFSNVQGIDAVLPAPPLVDPPLSLPGLTRGLVDLEGMSATQRQAVERAASAAERLAAIDEGDQPSDSDTDEDARLALEQQRSEWENELLSAEAMASDAAKRLAEQARWEHGFVYLPELPLGATSVWAPDTVLASEVGLAPSATNLKPDANNQDATYWYDPFVAIGLDDRSAFGWPHTDYTDRAQRAQRGLRAHEAWQCEHEFWTGDKIPTNYHLSASPDTPTSSPHRTTDAWPLPAAAPGTVLGTAVGLKTGIAALNEAIGHSDGGNGMIHATPFMTSMFMSAVPYIRDPDGKVYTVNRNLFVPGYGYPGTGPDKPSRNITDLVTTSGSRTATSAAAAFTTFDIGRPITQTSGSPAVPAGTVIASVTNATTVVLSAPASSSGSGLHATIAGTGGDASGSPVQWAYATDYVFHCRGDVHTYPYDLREMSPALTVNNDVPVRAERSWAFITNRLLRAAVLIDTTQDT